MLARKGVGFSPMPKGPAKRGAANTATSGANDRQEWLVAKVRSGIRFALFLVLCLQLGCGAMQKPSWRKPVGKGTWIPALVCGAIGAGVGIAIQNERRGCTTIDFNGQRSRDCDDRDLWKGGVIGAPIGAAVCALLGHVFLDPSPEVTLPEPPPPPPTPTPEPEAKPAVKKRLVLRGVNFDFDSAEIRPDSRSTLDEAVLLLGNNRDILVVTEGYTDSVGSAEYNQDLSVRRAEAVYRYLVNHGISPERLTVEGFGETRPIASNETEDGRAQNRRVELHVSGTDRDAATPATGD
jgi:outer membrane protein OmpA-like peptidoglycan-associated protein